MEESMNIVIGIVVGGLFTGLGLWGLFAEIRRVYRIRTWPSVVGQIIDSQVTEHDSEGRSYNVHVEYQYKVFGYPYTGSTNIMGVEANARKQAEDVCSSYPVGLEIRIAYNPERARQSEIADHAQRSIKSGIIVFCLGEIAFSIFWTYAMTDGFAFLQAGRHRMHQLATTWFMLAPAPR
jgi:hypothetical protein